MVLMSSLQRVLPNRSDRPFLPSLYKTARIAFSAKAKDVLVATKFKIVNTGTLNLASGGSYRFGTGFYGFMSGTEKSLIRNRGSLTFLGSVSIGIGARWDVGPGASVTIGAGTHFSPTTTLIAVDAITIGEDCAIAWDVQILDADFHAHGSRGEIVGALASEFTAPVKIGDHVWIGSHARLYKGVTIADGCIVAGNATVTRSFLESGSLIAGSPARVIKRGIEWK